jgi:hypothetical protein
MTSLTRSTFNQNENPDEFVVLDMHELKGLDEKSFDYKGFHEAIMSELGARLIPLKNRYLTLGTLKKTNPLQILQEHQFFQGTAENVKPADWNCLGQGCMIGV